MRTESKTKNRRESAAANRFIGDYDTVRPLLRYISYGCYHKSFLVERLGQSSRTDVLCRLQPLDPVDISRHEEIIETMFSFSPNGEAELFLEKPVRLPPTRAELREAHAMRARPRRAASNTTPRRTAAAPSSGSKMPDTWSLHLSVISLLAGFKCSVKPNARSRSMRPPFEEALPLLERRIHC